MTRRMLGPVVAAVLAAAGILLPTPQVAAASTAPAACAGADGVTVIVDYNELSDPDVRAACVPDGGGDSAAQLFRDAGFSLDYHPQQPGYVCRVTGLPEAGDTCLANDAFWSLWWSDGDSGRWVFSHQGVSGLSVPDGGYLAFAWHEGSGNAQPPDVVPTPHEDPVEPSEGPSSSQGGNGGGDNQGQNNGPSPTTAPPTTAAPTTATATATASSATATTADRKKRRDRPSDRAAVTASPSSALPGAAEITAGPPPSDLGADASGDDGSSVPTWIGLALAALVLGAAAVIAIVRRRPG